MHNTTLLLMVVYCKIYDYVTIYFDIFIFDD